MAIAIIAVAVTTATIAMAVILSAQVQIEPIQIVMVLIVLILIAHKTNALLEIVQSAIQKIKTETSNAIRNRAKTRTHVLKISALKELSVKKRRKMLKLMCKRQRLLSQVTSLSSKHVRDVVVVM